MSAPLSSDVFPWLVADVGGTNVRFGIVVEPGATPSAIRRYVCAEYPSLQDAALAYLEESGVPASARPKMAAFALATAIDGDIVKMTNSPWVISRSAAQTALAVAQLQLLNDFEALALALPRLGPADYKLIGEFAPRAGLTMAVIGPGTGLGVAGCVPGGGRWHALATEGGHVTACAADEFESEVLRAARAEHVHVSAERLLSGIGLPTLHRAVASARGRLVETLTPEEISNRALQTRDADCVATLETFCAMLGTFAGNVALTQGARGGVFIAGGIPGKLGHVFLRSRFRERFEAKGRFRDYLAAVATPLITASDVALLGAAQAIESVLPEDQ
jgi:glucokinase